MKVQLLIFLILIASTQAGPFAAGICYAGCAGVTVACFAAAGFTFGTVPEILVLAPLGAVIAATPALAACNAAFAACEAACMVAMFAPTP